MMYGYLQEYQVCDKSGRTITVELKTNDDAQPMKYVFHRISDDRMIVKEEHVFFDYKSSELSPYVYAIWERTESKTPIIQQLTTTSTFKDKPKIEPRGLYRYVAGGTPCRIREVRDSVISRIDNIDNKKVYKETYRLCTDTIDWNVVIGNYNLTIQGKKLEDILNYQRKQINIGNSIAFDDFYKDKWTLFDCSETGFSENWPDEILTYDKRGVTPIAQALMDILEGKIPYDANHPLYGTWEVEGRVLNPSETKIDSIIKGLCTDYVFPYIRNARCFYAFTPQHWCTMRSGTKSLYLDKLDSDGKTKLVTWEQYFEQGKGTTIVYLNWTLHWIDKDTLLICRDHQELRLPALPECLVLKRKVGGESLVNVINSKPPIHN
jgi:hypothetical protein